MARDDLIRVFKGYDLRCNPGCVREGCHSDVTCQVPRHVREAQIAALKSRQHYKSIDKEAPDA